VVLEDNDVLHIVGGGYGIYNTRQADVETAVPRRLQVLQLEVDQIMKVRKVPAVLLDLGICYILCWYGTCLLLRRLAAAGGGPNHEGARDVSLIVVISRLRWSGMDVAAPSAGAAAGGGPDHESAETVG
jgi:hypothetical protein